MRVGSRPSSSPAPGRPTSAAEVASAADITFLSLPSPSVMDMVALEWAAGAEPGKILVDLTTNSPATVRAVGARLARTGAQPARVSGDRRRHRRPEPLPRVHHGRRRRARRPRRAAARHDRTGDVPPRPARLRQRRQARQLVDGVHDAGRLLRRARPRQPLRHRPAVARRDVALLGRRPLLTSSGASRRSTSGAGPPTSPSTSRPRTRG